MRKGVPRRISAGLEDAWIHRLLPVLRNALFDEKLWETRLAKPGFELIGQIFKLSQFPFFRERLPEFDPAKSNLSWIPINQDIQGAEGTVLSEEVLGRLIEKARHRVIVKSCGCRKACRCRHYPQDIGCLMMGESALKIPAKMGRVVGIDEAKAHVKKAMDAGLIPVTGKARIDNDIFMIPDEGKLLTVCLCCECCCITRYSRHVPRSVLDGMHHPVEGLSVEVTEACIGCGTCMSRCYLQAIEMRAGRATIGEMCRVCGRCAMHCPQHAIRLKLDNPRAVQDVVRRIESAVDF
jgi:ferredoxin